jgi:hypothetical protein
MQSAKQSGEGQLRSPIFEAGSGDEGSNDLRGVVRTGRYRALVQWK